ncbi:MAG: dihydroorotase [Helicobacter sp.]|nr:dihydroorotase [Helicobacter sp.]
MKIQKIQLENPLDMHLHLREGAMLEAVLEHTSKAFVGAVVMPNLLDPIDSTQKALNYGNKIQSIAPNFTPFLTLYITEKLNAKELEKARNVDIKLLKLYPKGATTNSSAGLDQILTPSFLELLSAAQDLGFILCIHGESNGFVLEREAEFGSVFSTLSSKFPKLKIIIEHMSDLRSVKLINDLPNIFATITLHHMLLTLDDLLGGHLDPHSFCKPVVKTPKDREALLELALNAHPKVSFGSDSAPHLRALKHSKNAPAGVFSAPFLLERLATLFDKHNKLDNLQAFVSSNAQKIYDLNFTSKRIVTLEKCEPYNVGGELKFSEGEVEIMSGICDFKVSSF